MLYAIQSVPPLQGDDRDTKAVSVAFTVQLLADFIVENFLKTHDIVSEMKPLLLLRTLK